jgi:hypothetical protein
MVVHAKAMYNLGVMYEHGLGVEQSYERAFEYYEQAADLQIWDWPPHNTVWVSCTTKVMVLKETLQKQENGGQKQQHKERRMLSRISNS